MNKNNVNAKADSREQRAKQFVDAAAEFLKDGTGETEIDGDEISFHASVGQREIDVCCWFEAETSRARICMLSETVVPPALTSEVAAYMKTLLAIPGRVGGTLGIEKKRGGLMWSSYCQVTPTTPIDRSLVAEVIGVGVQQFYRMIELVAAFVAARTVAVSDNPRADSRSIFTNLDPNDQLLN
jgi:hypothetical protein